ncbi:MAG: hypothetical protein HZA79_05535 [Sphingobacteriales bacterium]|nr:hypothetical protein [Sphingobacteriales bacterium]
MEKSAENEKWLAHWVYNRSEWNRFNRWSLFKRGLGHFLLYFLNPARGKAGAEVKIGMDEVYIKEVHHIFSTKGKQLLMAEIYEAGRMYILEIRYRGGRGTGVVRIPVPKGKLKEAVMVESRLQETVAV